MAEHDHQSPGAHDRSEPDDPYAAPTPSPGAPAAWSAPTGYRPPPPARPQAWSGYATPYGASPDRAPKRRPANAWAIVALVTGIFGIVPVAVGAATAALVQIRRTHETGTEMAIAGLALAAMNAISAAFVVVVVAIVAAAVALGATSYSAGRVADAGSTTVGDCLREPTGQDSVAPQTDCQEGHFAEVYRTQDLGGTRWPGYEAIDQRADDVCYGAFEGYVGESADRSSYDYDYYLPDQAEWIAGEHRVVCVVLAGADDTLRGSVRDSRR